MQTTSVIDTAREGLSLAAGLLYLLGCAKVEGLALGALARAQRCAQGTAARVRRASEDFVASAGDLAEAAVAIPVGLAFYVLDPERGAGPDLLALLQRIAADLHGDRR